MPSSPVMETSRRFPPSSVAIREKSIRDFFTWFSQYFAKGHFDYFAVSKKGVFFFIGQAIE